MPDRAPPPSRKSRVWPLALGVAALALAAGAVLDQPQLLWLGAGGLALAAVWSAMRAADPPALHAPEAAPALAASEDRMFQAALEKLPDPVVIVIGGEPDDFAARRIRFANKQARILLRTAQSGASLVTALRDPAALEVIDEALYGGLARDIGYAAGGAQDRVWRLSVAPLPTENPAAPRAVIRFRDDTDTVRMERMRADFLANASHELKTPLASLAGFIETLKGHAKEDPRARDKFLDIMAMQTARMSRLINDLMSLSRIELHEHIAPSDRVDVALAAGDVLDALGPVVQARGSRLEVEAPGPGEAVAVGDRDQVIQVLQNLAENAVRYSPDGSTVTLRVETGLDLARAQAPRRPGLPRLALLTPDHGERETFVAVTVSDRGAGVARQHLPRLTERFFRVEGQKSGGQPGTGLGLSIVKHIVNRHRGGLVVESGPGEGTTFTAYLPMQPAAQPAEAGQRNKTVMEMS